MAKQTIDIGSSPNKGDGDPIRVAFDKINKNFTELYDGNFVDPANIDSSLIPQTTDTLDLGSTDKKWADLHLSDFLYLNGQRIEVLPNGSLLINGNNIVEDTIFGSDGTVTGNIVPDTDNTYDLGAPDKQWRSLYVSSDTIFIGGVPLAVDDQGTLTVGGSPVQGGVVSYNDLTDKPNIPADVSDLTDTEGLLGQGGSNSPIQPYLEVTNAPFIVQSAVLDTPVEFTRTAEGSETDPIDTGLTLARSGNRALYNIESEVEYDSNNYTSPAGTEWNSDGWGDLLDIRSRSYTTLRAALNNAIGDNIVGAELVMHDNINDKYYKFNFTDWGQNNGGSFAYTRTLVTDPNFFEKKDYATANNIDVIENDSTLQIGITRGNNQGIYNPFTEEGWDETVSPDGTLWNIDGWDDLTNVEERTYTNFYAAYGSDNIGLKIPGSKAILYVPSIEKYYAVQWLSWTQGSNGGGFSYYRYEIDVTELNEGIKFADGTIQKTAYIPTNVKSTASGNRRIEEVAGSKTVSVTSVTTNTITAVASRSVVDDNRFWVSNTATDIADIINNSNTYGIQDQDTIQFSLDNSTWYTYNSGYTGTETEIGVNVAGGPFTYNEGDTIYFRYDSGGGSVVWWDKADLPGGSSDFRGAIIDYHAYTGEATWIGTIYIADDTGNEHITHIETSSGTSDSENDNLWIVTSEGRIRYRRTDGEAKTLKVHWTAKVFYGSEYYD